LPKLYGCQVGLPNCWSCSYFNIEVFHTLKHVRTHMHLKF
jgi:hypothetical protein